jgi:hypothetical protein
MSGIVRSLLHSRIGVLVIVLAFLLITLFSQGLAFTTYRSQWEVNSEVVAFDIKGPITNPPSQPPKPPDNTPKIAEVYRGWTIYYVFDGPFPSFYAQKGTVKSPKFDYIYKCKTWVDNQEGGMWLSIYKMEPASSLTWDFDNAETGMPDIRATVSDIREEKNATVYEPLKKEEGNFTYVTEYHEYIVDVQIRTVADMKMIEDPNVGPEWYHETSMPYSWKSNLWSGADHIGKNIAGSVFVRFSVLPWGTYDYGPLPANYQFNGYWLGVMNAKVEGVSRAEAEQTIPSEAITFQGDARDVATEGTQLNMKKDDGTYVNQYTSIPWDPDKVLDPDIQSTVVVELPFDLLAGAWMQYDPSYFTYFGGIIQAKPIDYYIQYKVRMECLVTKELEFREPATPANPSPLDTPSDYVPYKAPSFFDQYGFWIIVIAIVIVGLVILGAWIGIPFMMVLSSIFRFCRIYDIPYSKG